jgi:hypothetical protein
LVLEAERSLKILVCFVFFCLSVRLIRRIFFFVTRASRA